MAKMQKVTAEKYLAEVSPDKVFWSHDGRVFRSLFELQAGLQDMSEETFRYHANESKNDFSKWVAGVIEDQKLSRDLLKNPEPGQTARLVTSRIVFLKRVV